MQRLDRISDYRGFNRIQQKKLNQRIGGHLNHPGHTLADLVYVERVLPKGNDALRKICESYWINEYIATSS